MRSNTTVFEKITLRQVPAHIVYEDDTVIAFLDINPLTKGHTLVCPKKPIDHIDDCDEATYTAVFAAVQKLSKRIRQVYKPKRVGVVVHGFEIPHAHVHVVPMYTETDMKLADRKNSILDENYFQRVKQDLSIE